ncbi:MAG: hypothetical protein AAB557_01090 [Patescibacteria group bacterium]
MPKKTKKEKIIAQYRRKLQGLHETVPASTVLKQSTRLTQTPSSSPFVYQAKTNDSHGTVTAIQPIDQAIRKDLVKTLMLAAIAIGGEIVLSVMMGK